MRRINISSLIACSIALSVGVSRADDNGTTAATATSTIARPGTAITPSHHLWARNLGNLLALPGHIAGRVKKTVEQRTKETRQVGPMDTWLPPEGVQFRAALLCVHGLGLHNSDYEEFGKAMARRGYVTSAIDMAGFGSFIRKEAEGNTRSRQTVDFEYSLKEVSKGLGSIHLAHRGLAVFLMGESMGGAIALHTGAEYPQLMDGIIACAPAGERFGQKGTDLKVALHFLIGPRRRFDVGSGIIHQASGDPCSHACGSHLNEKLKENWASDTLNRKGLSPTELIAFQRFMNGNHSAVKNVINKPVLLIQGNGDRLVRPEGTVKLYKELATADKKLELIPDAPHLIFEESQFNDPGLTNKSVVLIDEWISAHLKRQGGDVSQLQDPGVAVQKLNPPDAMSHRLCANLNGQHGSLTATVAGKSIAIESMVLRGKAALKAGHFAQAIACFQNALDSMGTTAPGSCECHFCLGQALCKQEAAKKAKNDHQARQDFVRARNELKMAIRAGHGNTIAKEANTYMMSNVPAEFLIPRTGKGTELIAAELGISSMNESNERPKAKVFEFYARWCEPCNRLKPVINKLKAQYGDRVDFVSYDVDKQTSEPFVDRYEVSPIPTVIFLTPNNQVVDYLLGYSGEESLEKSVRKILLQDDHG